LELYFWIPSTNTLSPTLNGLVENPSTGVVMKQVKIPLEEDCTCWILIPLVLLIVNRLTVFSGRPLGCCSTFTSEMEFPVNFTSKIPPSIFFPVVEFTSTIDGGLVYPFPPSITEIVSIVFESLIVITGDMNAVGCKVLSEEYSNPSLIILTSFALPIVDDFAIIYASLPSKEFNDTNTGSFL